MVKFRVGATVSDSSDGDALIGGYLFPRRVRITPLALEMKPGLAEPTLTADFEIRDGVPECVALSLNASRFGRPITSAFLSGLDVEKLAEDAFMQQAHKPLPGGGFAFPAVAGGEAFAREVRERLRGQRAPHTSALERAAVADLSRFEDLQTGVHKRARERDPRSNELLRAVARTYLENLDRAPTEAVKRWLGRDTTRRTAERRVQQARDAGMLPRNPEHGRALRGDYLPFLQAMNGQPESHGLTLDEARKRFARRRDNEDGGEQR